MTPAEALATVRYQVAEPSANFWSNDEIYVYLTQGERELANKLECNIASTAMTVSASVYSYTTGVSDFVNVDHITYSGGEAAKLKHVDFRGLQTLDDQALTSDAQSGDPTHYWRNGDSVILWPTPDASATCQVYGTKVCTAVVSGSSTFTIPNQFTDYLPEFALYRMHLKDQDDSRASLHLALWNEHKNRAQMEYTRRKYSDMLLVVKDEESYPTTLLGMV